MRQLHQHWNIMEVQFVRFPIFFTVPVRKLKLGAVGSRGTNNEQERLRIIPPKGCPKVQYHKKFQGWLNDLKGQAKQIFADFISTAHAYCQNQTALCTTAAPQQNSDRRHEVNKCADLPQASTTGSLFKQSLQFSISYDKVNRHLAFGC